MRFLFVIAVLAVGPLSAAPRPEISQPWGLSAKDYVVAADHPLASAAGAGILAAGGNVIDAAAATSFVLAVVRPHSAGLGGGGFMLYKPAGKEAVFLDYRETAPDAAETAAYLGPDGRPIPGKTESGSWAVGVPGHLRGVPLMLAKYGTFGLPTVVASAIELAERGFPVDAHLREAMEDLASRIAKSGDPARYAEAARIFLKDGKPYAVGEVLRQPDLAATLRTLAAEGPDAFYRGALSKKILAGLEGGPMTAEDLASYEPTFRPPVVGRYRGRTVLSAPPPSSGGACLVEMLGALDGFSARTLAKPEGHALVVEAMKHAFADRARLLGDPDAHPEVEENAAAMTSPRRAKELKKLLDAPHTKDPSSYGVQSLPDDSGTTHYVVMDAHGNAVAATETVNLFFGSMVVPPGTGVVLNNQMDDFAVSTGVANAFGLRQSDLNLVGPGRRPLSSMSPTILLERGEAVLAAGGSGGPRIITGVLWSILNSVDRGMAPDAAVAAPRIHHQWSPDVVRFDPAVPADVREELEVRGHRLVPAEGEAAVQLAVRDRHGLSAASDPRKGGRPAGR
ncbi:MAG: gamma-glutamyltranspeptidase [Elusimicrobia bacterium]|nr:MAG: gamma-glutamyltranspeptidase [Elusimicrobiota bacterium]